MSPREIFLADAAAGDYDDILRLNAEAVPNVNLIARELLEQLHREAFAFRVARSGAAIGGFVLALPERASYTSLNYRWFQKQYETFVYVDRIVVAPAQRGAGIGQALYADLESQARGRAPILACEVNIRPPNPGSMAFHTRFGFREVGQQDTEGGAKRVSLLAKDLR